MILVDSNIILDILTEDPNWYDWSASTLETLAEDNKLIINDVIYSEISISFRYIEELEEVLTNSFIIQPIPKEALFLAGKVFIKSLLGIFPAACGVIWRNEQIYTQKSQCYRTAVSHGISSKISPSSV